MVDGLLSMYKALIHTKHYPVSFWNDPLVFAIKKFIIQFFFVHPPYPPKKAYSCKGDGKRRTEKQRSDSSLWGIVLLSCHVAVTKYPDMQGVGGARL